jgi:hypothetical protein
VVIVIDAASNKYEYQEFSWESNVWPAYKAYNHTTICEATVYKMWDPWHLTTVWASTVRDSDSSTVFFCFTVDLFHIICSLFKNMS